jgi:hypothetical protein
MRSTLGRIVVAEFVLSLALPFMGCGGSDQPGPGEAGVAAAPRPQNEGEVLKADQEVRAKLGTKKSRSDR